MKKLFALLLALSLVVCMAACGGNNDTTTEPEQTTTAPEEITTTTEEPDAGVIQAGVLSSHENGWESQVWTEEGSGIYFNLWANDLPVDESWATRYFAVNPDGVKLIRDGEVYQYGGLGYNTLVKFGTTAYYLAFDKWITQEQFPLQEGDVVIIEGDFTNLENGLTIHFDKTYIQCKVGSITKFTTTAPEGITE